MGNIAVIIARGGSKRIPKKNIKEFLGKPIITYSIEAALKSNLFDEVMVSTDDMQIAEFANKFGANVPFLRSSKNSNDFATTVDVLIEVLNEYKKIGKEFEKCCCIYPTAPFVTPIKLKKAYEYLNIQNAYSVIPICEFSFSIYRSFGKNLDKIYYNYPEFEKSRSQDLPKSYHDCGQFYFFDVVKFLKKKSLVSNETIGLEVSQIEVQDIDNIDDWLIAEMKYNLLQKKINDEEL